eukprot:scaffold4487_cov273-Chaetoceros_neogracile.AAC.34
MGLDSDAPRPVCLLQYASYCLLFISIYDTTVVLRRCCCSYDTLRYHPTLALILIVRSQDSALILVARKGSFSRTRHTKSIYLPVFFQHFQ